MGLHAAAMLGLNQLRPGDILINYDDDEPDHSLLWVGGNKPVVHSADSGNTSGIVQQSDKIFRGQGQASTEVYRSRNQRLGAETAKIAQGFAVSTTDRRYIKAKNKQWTVNLVTKFSQDRLGGNGGI